MITLKRALLLSVHPQYVEAILLGTKTVEIRRRRVAVEPGTPLTLYVTSPAKALLGAARIATVEVGATTRYGSCITSTSGSTAPCSTGM